ncbi:D-methionine transport system substrate-binding protein [Sediminihabitans luteus]|uniref:D-methionine transport system substrate-binding protein n=1 Tax=Sediminihabitans luteus TaxID=1138585 RepID=A0A2M9CEM8_9CELL|nr:MetQ/NlpA family ABC transporter substrate-binding protein [Sediminihabitans luteus]PJJ70338.1 D-methionine transport system substrate-binding protein [Sediminihabitans luteus]GII97810.1 methionine ABC transporter substrate-binding protein [Sediminihabitans luteus]
MLRRTLTWTAIAATAALTLTACGSDAEAGFSAGTADDPIVIGVVKSSDQYWTDFTDAAADAGLTVEIKNFSDYTVLNQALAEGELDLNQFQHLQFLAGYNTDAGEDLTPVGATAVYPLALYSTAHASLDEIPDGGQVAIPNDPTNQARALLVLQEAGLITLAGGGTAFSTPADIDADASKVTVTPVNAAQTALALQDVDASIVNNDYVGDAGLTEDDALFSDDPDSDAAKPYINVWVARADDADDPDVAKLVEIFHTEKVEQGVLEASGGTGVIKDNPASELQEILAQIESDLKASQG